MTETKAGPGDSSREAQGRLTVEDLLLPNNPSRRPGGHGAVKTSYPLPHLRCERKLVNVPCEGYATFMRCILNNVHVNVHVNSHCTSIFRRPMGLCPGNSCRIGFLLSQKESILIHMRNAYAPSELMRFKAPCAGALCITGEY